jgi:predicted DNA-binding transcriptional regulator YafY
VGQKLQAALLKLSAALPAGRHDEQVVRDRIHLDSTWWFQQKEPVPHLSLIQQALWQNRKLHVTLIYRAGWEVQLERLAAPYGLVAKTSVWYLVWSDGVQVRVDRVSHIVNARMADERFERPADFDLVPFWRAWCARVEGNRPHYPVTARVAPDFLPLLARSFGDKIGRAAASPDAEGWLTVTLPFETLEEARARILSFGRGVEVLEPWALRRSVADFAAQTASLYTD